MNKILSTILSCAIVLCFCSCQPEPKNATADSGTDEILSEEQFSQSDNPESSSPAIQDAEPETTTELPLSEKTEPEEIAADPVKVKVSLEEVAEAEEITVDPVEVEVPLEEVAEPLKDDTEQSKEVESTDKQDQKKIIADKPQEQASLPLDVFYEKYGHVLKKYVDKNGNVDYRTLKRKRRDLLSATQQLANLNANTLVSFKSEDEEKAFWINAHNILTLKLIIDNYPIKRNIMFTPWYPFDSIKHIPGGRGKTFFPVASFSYTISEIEQNLLEKFKDPKLCFAFSYASASSPMLRNEVYTGEKLDAQLEDQIAGFFKKSTSFMINRQKNIVRLSSVFKLYGKVFLNSEYAKIMRYRDKKEDVRAYLNFLDSYISVADMKYLQNEEYKINYMVFGWNLNEKKR